MDPAGPSDDAHAGNCPAPSTKRIRMQLVNKMPDNPKRLVFESTQQRYEIPLRQDEGFPSSHGTTSGSAPRDRGTRHSLSKQPSVAPSSRHHSHKRTHVDQRTVHKVPCNLKRVIFESTQERFEHHIRQDNVSPAPGHDSDDDFMPFPNTRSSTHIDNSNHVGPRKSRNSRAGTSTDEERQREKRSNSRSSTINVRCNPADVVVTAQLMNDEQFKAIEADGFGHFLRLKIDAIEHKYLLFWILDHTDPISMEINIGPGKVLPITPWIISMVLGLPIGGDNLKMYSRKEGVTHRQHLISELNQNLPEDCNIHISNLQQEILKGDVNPLMKRCFFLILCNRLLLPSSSNFITSNDIKRTMDHEMFSVVDWSQLVFNDLQLAVRAWHNRDKSQLTQSISGCTIFLILYYLDNIDHRMSPLDRTSTPRITMYNNDLIHRLVEADRIISILGAVTYGKQPFKRWETTCYATADVRSAPYQHTNLSMPGIIRRDIPRLNDLLSQCLSGLTSQCKDRVQGFFAQFDETLSLNTRSIEQSLGNIVRAQAKLADQIRPLLHTNWSSQSQIDDTLSFNIRSLDQSLGHIVTANAKLADQFSTILHKLSSSAPLDNNIPADSSTSLPMHSDHDIHQSVHLTPRPFSGHRSPVCTPNMAPVLNTTSVQRQSSSSDVSLSKASSTVQAQHGQGSATTPANKTFSGFNWPCLDHIPEFKLPGKRIVRKPSKYYSPFKLGIVSHPPPNPEYSLRMHEYLCADHPSLKSKTVMHFGIESLTGHHIALSFAIGKFIHTSFMDGFVKCLAEDEFHVRPECLGYRLFLQPLVSDILLSDHFSLDKPHHLCRPQTIVEVINRCLPSTDLKKAKLIFLPVLHLCHWTVYCINVAQSRVDVLDSMDYTSNDEATWETYHSSMGQTLTARLSLALSVAAPRTFPNFANWRHVPIKLPFQRDVNDSALFSMKFIEFYDGEGHGSLQTTIQPSVELRAQILHYLVFHSANRVHAPVELLPFRID